MISTLDVVAARRRLQPHLLPSPLRRSAWLSTLTGANVYLKLECAQSTNSFKIRGAFNAALRVLEGVAGNAALAPAIVTASAGNHGRGLALAAAELGLQTTIFTPQGAPATKKAAIRRHGAVLRDDPPDYDAAEQAARAHATATGALYISPYNHPDVMAGAGTVALEILDVLPAFDAIIVPIGGGGLLSGVGTVVKSCVSQARVVGVETAASTPFAVSLARGAITAIDVRPSLADGLIGNLEPGSATFGIVRKVVDDLRHVEETEIAHAIRALAAEEHLIAEGAGAVATAAVLSGNLVRRGETVVVLVSGANIDLDTFLRVALSGPGSRDAQ